MAKRLGHMRVPVVGSDRYNGISEAELGGLIVWHGERCDFFKMCSPYTRSSLSLSTKSVMRGHFRRFCGARYVRAHSAGFIPNKPCSIDRIEAPIPQEVWTCPS